MKPSFLMIFFTRNIDSTFLIIIVHSNSKIDMKTNTGNSLTRVKQI